MLAELAYWQVRHGRYSAIRNPTQGSFWNLKPIRWLTDRTKQLGLSGQTYWHPSSDKTPDVETYLLHNMPNDIFEPLPKKLRFKVSREQREKVMNTILAYCVTNLYTGVVHQRQHF